MLDTVYAVFRCWILCILFLDVGYCIYCFQMLDTAYTVFRCWILCILFSDVGYCVYCFQMLDTVFLLFSDVGYCVYCFQMLGSSDNKPAFLTDRGMEQAIKTLLRKFPQYDVKASQV